MTGIGLVPNMTLPAVGTWASTTATSARTAASTRAGFVPSPQ